MVTGYSLDPHHQANFAKQQFAVIHLPRKKRDRIPATSVKITSDLPTAITQSNPKNYFYPAKVVGPARSSEGTLLYYIIELY